MPPLGHIMRTIDIDKYNTDSDKKQSQNDRPAEILFVKQPAAKGNGKNTKPTPSGINDGDGERADNKSEEINGDNITKS